MANLAVVLVPREIIQSRGAICFQRLVRLRLQQSLVVKSQYHGKKNSRHSISAAVAFHAPYGENTAIL